MLPPSTRRRPQLAPNRWRKTPHLAFAHVDTLDRASTTTLISEPLTPADAALISHSKEDSKCLPPLSQLSSLECVVLYTYNPSKTSVHTFVLANLLCKKYFPTTMWGSCEHTLELRHMGQKLLWLPRFITTDYWLVVANGNDRRSEVGVEAAHMLAMAERQVREAKAAREAGEVPRPFREPVVFCAKDHFVRLSVGHFSGNYLKVMREYGYGLEKLGDGDRLTIEVLAKWDVEVVEDRIAMTEVIVALAQHWDVAKLLKERKVF